VPDAPDEPVLLVPAVPLLIIGLALEFGERLSIAEEPAEPPMPVVALVPLFETEGLLLRAVEPMPLVVVEPVLALAPGPHGCGLTFVLEPGMPPLLLVPGAPAPPVPPLMPADPVDPAPPPALPPPAPPPPPACAKATVEPAARNAAVRMARL